MLKNQPDHLIDLHERASKDLKPMQSQKVASLLNKFHECFSKDEWDLGLTHLTAHEIKTGHAAPIKQPPRRVPLAYAEKENAAIEEFKDKDFL